MTHLRGKLFQVLFAQFKVKVETKKCILKEKHVFLNLCMFIISRYYP
jgi:hypothetical protein